MRSRANTKSRDALFFPILCGWGHPWRHPCTVAGAHLGTRTAELIEAPIMLVVIVFTANWVIRRCDIPPAPYKRLAVGVTSLGILLLAEFTVVLGLQRLTVDDYLASRDPVAGTVYVLLLSVYLVASLRRSKEHVLTQAALVFCESTDP